VVDPQPEIAPYLEAAAQKKMRITHVIETHIQADHRSGARDLVAATGAETCLHEAARVSFPFRALRDDEVLEVGNVKLRVIHTPGHTPESLCLLVTDESRAAMPWFLLTGDTLFSGGVGRPDLVGGGVERALAAQLYDSLHGKLLTLPDHLEIYPAHFGGAACGKGLSGKPMSTLGFERLFNPALQITPKEAFVEFALTDLPELPPVFDVNRRINAGVG